MNLNTTPSNIVLVVGRRGCGKTCVVNALTNGYPSENIVILSPYSRYSGTPDFEAVDGFISDPFGYCSELDRSMSGTDGYALVLDDVVEMNHRRQYMLDGGKSPFAALLKLRQTSNAKGRRLTIIIIVQLLPNLPAYIRTEFDALLFHRFNASQGERKFYSHAHPPKDLSQHKSADGKQFDWWMTRNTSYELSGYTLVRDGPVNVLKLGGSFSMDPNVESETDNGNIVTINANIELQIDIANKKVVGISLIK